jgi:hypothetical protein
MEKGGGSEGEVWFAFPVRKRIVDRFLCPGNPGKILPAH